MASLFDKNKPDGRRARTPEELIEKEVRHLRKGQSTRHHNLSPSRTATWLLVLVIGALIWLYVMDPITYAWYKGEGVRTYLYLHSFGSGKLEQQLLLSGIFSSDEIEALKHRQGGAYQDYYATPQDAERQAKTIITHMENVRLLHEGKYQQLHWIGKLRYALFIRLGIPVPTQWSFLNPTID